MTTAEQAPFMYEPEESCSLLAAIDYAISSHEHYKTTKDREVVRYSCEMVLDDTPVKDTLAETERTLLAANPQYKTITGGTALHYAWLCKSMFGELINFSPAIAQVQRVGHKPLLPIERNFTEVDVPFQSYFVDLGHVQESEEKPRLTAFQVFCHGVLDLTLWPEHVDKPGYVDGQGIYEFSQEQRVFGINLFPSGEMFWRPEVGLIKVSRNFPGKEVADDFFGAEVMADPYAMTQAMLAKIACETQKVV